MNKTTLCKEVLTLLLIFCMSFSFLACDKPDLQSIDVTEDERDTEVSNNAIFIYNSLTTPIAKGEFDSAYSILEDYFSENNWESVDGEYLYPYYSDLTVLLNMRDVDPTLYHEVFQSFETPECFLAAMVYYPFFAKKSAYTKDTALVLLPESNNVSFSTCENVTDDEFNEIYLSCPDAESAKKITVYMDGIAYNTVIFKTTEGTYRMWDTTTTNESSYMMSVAKWKSLE